MNQLKERKQDKIRREDCPPGKAPFFPGRKNKNNKNGTELSKSEFVNKMIEVVFQFVKKLSHLPILP